MLALSSALAHAQVSRADLFDLLSRYKEARAETRVYLDTNSVSTAGTVEQGNAKYPFELAQRESGQIRLELTANGLTIIQVFDGRSGWLWTSDRPNAGVRRLTPEQLRFFQLNNSFYSPLDEPRRFGFQISYVDLELNEEGEPEHHLRLKSSSKDDQMDIWLNANTFLEVRRAYRPEVNAEPLITHFNDYRNVDGIMAPFTVVTEFQGEVLSTTKVEEIKRNPGLLSFYFTKPSTYEVVEESTADDS